MNINRLCAPDSLVTPPRRVSTRNKTPLFVDSKCFQRPYKRGKEKPKEELTLQSSYAGEGPCREEPQSSELFDLSTKIFRSIPETRRQAKAIRSFRIKKLKKLLAGQGHPSQVLPAIVFLTKQLQLYQEKLKSVACRGRSLSALSRARNPHGKFLTNSRLSTLKEEMEKDYGPLDSCSDQNTTTACSQSELPTLDCDNVNSNHNWRHFEDLFLFEHTPEEVNQKSQASHRDSSEQPSHFSIAARRNSLQFEGVGCFLSQIASKNQNLDVHLMVDQFWDFFQNTGCSSEEVNGFSQETDGDLFFEDESTNHH